MERQAAAAQACSAAQHYMTERMGATDWPAAEGRLEERLLEAQTRWRAANPDAARRFERAAAPLRFEVAAQANGIGLGVAGGAVDCGDSG